MEKLAKYRTILLELIKEYYHRFKNFDAIETYLVIDHDNDHFQLMQDGWKRAYRYYGAILHFDIKDGKIWVRHDGTEDGIAPVLVERGVAPSDIVLAYHSPFVRKFTNYAVG